MLQMTLPPPPPKKKEKKKKRSVKGARTVSTSSISNSSVWGSNHQPLGWSMPIHA